MMGGVFKPDQLKPVIEVNLFGPFFGQQRIQNRNCHFFTLIKLID